MTLSRRHFLATLPGMVATLLAKPVSGQAPLRPKRSNRVLFVGAGFAGSMVALTLKQLAPRVEVAVIEKGEFFISAPSALEYVFGMKSWAQITRGYEALTSRGIRLLRAEVQAIEPDREVVRTTTGPLEYTLLVLATGIRLANEEIAGLKENSEVNASLYDRSSLAELRRRVESYQGGTILLSIPPPPLQCPPAPYEFALLFAEQIRQRRLKGRIIVLDSNTEPQPPSLSRPIEEALQRNQDIIEYVPAARVNAWEVGSRKVVTQDSEKFSYDLLSLSPPHKAARFIKDAGLSGPGDPFVEVDPFSFRSTKFETIYALGDAARTPYARTASSAVLSAGICAKEIARNLGVKVKSPSSFQSVCYPYVSWEEALRLRLDYSREAGMVRYFDEQVDPLHGGFGQERKFSHARFLAFLLELEEITRDRGRSALLEKTLEAIQRGIFDPLEGGFYRYAERRDWTEPHTEKMLYVNTALATVFQKASQVFNRSSYARIGEATTAYLLRTLYDPKSGGFYGSQSADPNYYRLSPADRNAAQKPLVNRDKLTAWNAEAILALFRAAQSKKRRDLNEAALHSLDFMQKHLLTDRGVYHIYRGRTGRVSSWGS